MATASVRAALCLAATLWLARPGRLDAQEADRLVVGAHGPESPKVLAGAKPYPRPGDLTLNINPATKPHVVSDINRVPSLKSGSFRHVYFENVPYSAFTRTNTGAIRESMRLLKPGGRLTISTGLFAPMDDVVGQLRREGFRSIRILVKQKIIISAVKPSGLLPPLRAAPGVESMTFARGPYAIFTQIGRPTPNAPNPWPWWTERAPSLLKNGGRIFIQGQPPSAVQGIAARLEQAGFQSIALRTLRADSHIHAILKQPLISRVLRLGLRSGLGRLAAPLRALGPAAAIAVGTAALLESGLLAPTR